MISKRTSQGPDVHTRSINGTLYLFTRAAGRIFVHRYQGLNRGRWIPVHTF